MIAFDRQYDLYIFKYPKHGAKAGTENRQKICPYFKDFHDTN